MKNKKLALSAATAAIFALSGAAFAQDGAGWHADIGYEYFDLEVETPAGDGDANFGAAVAHIGYDFNTYWSLEGQLGVGLDDEDLSEPGVDAEIGIQYVYGGFLRGTYPMTEQVALTARGGFVGVELEASFDDGVTSLSGTEGETAAAFGAGVVYSLNDRIVLRGDYTFYGFDDAEAHGFFIGVGSDNR